MNEVTFHQFADIGWFKLDSLPHPLHINLELGLKRYREKLESALHKL